MPIKTVSIHQWMWINMRKLSLTIKNLSKWSLQLVVWYSRRREIKAWKTEDHEENPWSDACKLLHNSWWSQCMSSFLFSIFSIFLHRRIHLIQMRQSIISSSSLTRICSIHTQWHSSSSFCLKIWFLSKESVHFAFKIIRYNMLRICSSTPFSKIFKVRYRSFILSHTECL